MNPITFDKTFAQLVDENPKYFLVLQKFHIEYEAARGLTLGEVCALNNLNPVDVLDELEVCAREVRFWDETALLKFDIPQLVGYILFTHHAYLEKELPYLEELLVEAIQIDGADHSELLVLLSVFREFRDALALHMKEEESILFPFFLFLVAPRQSPALPPESVESLTRVIHQGDEAIRSSLKRMRTKTRDFHVPEDSGRAYRELFHALSRMEFELHRHMHVENNILFPKVIVAEKELQRRQIEALPLEVE